MNKILVTGATGNVGCKVVEKLKNYDCTIRLALRDPEEITLTKNDIERVAFDFADPGTYEEYFNNSLIECFGKRLILSFRGF